MYRMGMVYGYKKPLFLPIEQIKSTEATNTDRLQLCGRLSNIVLYSQGTEVMLTEYVPFRERSLRIVLLICITLY